MSSYEKNYQDEFIRMTFEFIWMKTLFSIYLGKTKDEKNTSG